MKNKIAKIIVDITKEICKVHAPYSIKEMTEEKCLKIIAKMQIGDMILIKTKGELTTSLQGEDYTHSAIVLTNDLVSEAITSDVKITHALYMLARTDEAILIRPKFKFDDNKISEYALKRTNYPYDYYFDDSDEAFYCHELSAKNYMQAATGIVINKVKTPLGYKWMPESFLDSGLFEKIL